ncbi:hypothetical protein FGO68_gene1433 [Halteria grandinella]|uniref:Uncharacterized protein n=1 Tax=Halteria grandinella TaxID=5974 RepID=A0A8J8NUF3_HALGN|nr:hypothetical protein FGO68_gene1433 [Halteria grandinella]
MEQLHIDECRCKRGQPLKYYCAQDNCQLHKDDIFSCELCIEDLMKRKQPHINFFVSHLMDEVKGKWNLLIEKEEQMYREITTQYASQKSVIESLEMHAQGQTQFQGRLICRDLLSLQQFHDDFTTYLSENDYIINSSTIRQLHPTLDKCAYFSQILDREFTYLLNLANPEFLLSNYSTCIDACRVSFNYEEKAAREQMLAMKVRLGKQKIQEAQSATRMPLNPQELEDAFNTLRQAVALQEAQMKAFVSLVGNLEGAAALVNMCINSQSREELATVEQLQSERGI